MATQPNVQSLSGGENLRDFACEELRVDYIFQIGGVVRDDVNDSFNNLTAT